MRLAVVTMATGDAGRRMLYLTRPVLELYAHRIGADFRVIRGDKVSPASPIAAKFALKRYFDTHDRLIYMDADCVVAPDCPSLFDVVPETHFGAYDEIHDMLASPQGRGWLDAERVILCESQGWDLAANATCINAGIMVASRRHAKAFEPFAAAFPKYHCADQHAVAMAVRRENMPLYNLPKTYNYGWWCNRGEFDSHRPMIAHFSGMSHSAGGPGNAAREALIRARVEELYPHLLPAGEDECVHRGGRLPAASAKAWYTCTRPGFRRLGLPVTDCRGCGATGEQRCYAAKCDGYAAD